MAEDRGSGLLSALRHSGLGSDCRAGRFWLIRFNSGNRLPVPAYPGRALTIHAALDKTTLRLISRDANASRTSWHTA